MKNQPLEWQQLWDAMEANPDQWIETTQNMYFEMLCVLPPTIMRNDNFLVGEPLRHVNGEAVYSCFTKFGDTYKARNLTIKQFAEFCY